MKDDDVVRDAGPDPGSTGGRITDADTVVAALRPLFRACYQKGLDEDPVAQGCAIIRAVVPTDGSVASTRILVREGLSESVGACIEGVVASARFAPRSGSGSSSLNIPVKFLAEKKQN